jgi:NAD(P)-dependent dehydrogenase (short-subunit alcohol dehydrogenase family)
MRSPKRLKNRIAMVTGASRGIGRAVAHELAAEGAHVIITGRTQGALEELDDEIRSLGGTATILVLDLANGDRLDQLGPTIFQRWEKLDIFVANAAILGPLSPLPHVTAQSWSAVMDSNLNANWRLIRTLDPLLRRSDAGRVVFVSSGAASGTNAYWGPYAVSKAGLEALARTYAEEVRSTPIRCNIVHPGATRTQMRARAFPGEDPSTLPPPAEVARFIVALALSDVTATGQTHVFRADVAAREPARLDEDSAQQSETPD